MKELIIQFAANIILVGTLIYIWHYIQGERINFKNKKIYITLISLAIISLLNYLFVDKFIKITLITIVFMLFFRFLFKTNIRTCVITPIFYQLIIMISETIFVVFATILFGNSATSIISSCFGTFTANVIIAFISVLLFKTKFIKCGYYKLINLTEKIKLNKLFIFSLIILLIANILAVATYYKFDFKYILIINAIITFGCSVIMYYLFRTQNNYNKVSDKYNIAMSSLKEYENMMSKYRVANHENKNLLLTIRAMIINKEKDIPKYIDSMIEERYEDDEKLLYSVSRIPVGGLRATIYTEILKIQRNKINYTLDVDKRLSAVDLIELENKDIIAICKIVGVIIDNAVDAVKKLKNRNISISIYNDKEKILLKVSNNYKGKVEVDKLFDMGYSTKGTGRGYGLSLVKKIMDENDNIDHEIEISKHIFSIIISIKYKKTR